MASIAWGLRCSDSVDPDKSTTASAPHGVAAARVDSLGERRSRRMVSQAGDIFVRRTEPHRLPPMSNSIPSQVPEGVSPARYSGVDRR